MDKLFTNESKMVYGLCNIHDPFNVTCFDLETRTLKIRNLPPTVFRFIF